MVLLERSSVIRFRTDRAWSMTRISPTISTPRSKPSKKLATRMNEWVRVRAQVHGQASGAVLDLVFQEMRAENALPDLRTPPMAEPKIAPELA